MKSGSKEDLLFAQALPSGTVTQGSCLGPPHTAFLPSTRFITSWVHPPSDLHGDINPLHKNDQKSTHPSSKPALPSRKTLPACLLLAVQARVCESHQSCSSGAATSTSTTAQPGTAAQQMGQGSRGAKRWKISSSERWAVQNQTEGPTVPRKTAPGKRRK